MHLDAAILFNVTELAKTVHKEAHARTGRSYHPCKSLLGNWRNQSLRLTRLAICAQARVALAEPSAARALWARRLLMGWALGGRLWPALLKTTSL